MRVRETIHHGNYYNVREVELSDLSTESLLGMVQLCPYAVTFTNQVEDTMRMALASGGSYSHGWVDWDVIRPA